MKFFCHHSFGPGGLTRPQLEQLLKTAQQDAVVKGYRSFANLSEGKMVWVIEASDKLKLAYWLRNAGLPFSSILEVEVESEYGEVQGLHRNPKVVTSAPGESKHIELTYEAEK